MRDAALTVSFSVRNRAAGGIIETNRTIAFPYDQGPDGHDALFAAVLDELSAIASVRLRGERHVSLETDDLVNEAVLRLMQLDRIEWQTCSHVIAMAARMMRRVLVDRARKRQAAKREHRAVTLDTRVVGEPPISFDLLALEAALDALGERDPERVRLVEMRFYGGMTTDEIATATGLSVSTVKRRWATTRAWLETML